MLNFRYFLPTQIIFGKDTVKMVGDEIRKRGGTRVLVHYSSDSSWAKPILSQVYSSLEEAGLSYISLGGVVPNPRLSLIRKGIELGKKEKVDFILAVGGGSVIDSAKGIGYGIKDDGDVWDFYLRKRTPEACIPIGVVLTVAGAGSETSDGSVVTNEDGWLKRDFGSDLARPRFAIMNPELTYSLSPYQSASSGADIIMHAMERYFTLVDHVELSDRLCESIMKTVMHNLPIVLCNPDDYDAPENLEKGQLILTPNTYFIGTANKDDSTFTITDKVIDRAIVIDFENTQKELKFDEEFNPIALSYEKLHELFKEASENYKFNEAERNKFLKVLDFMSSELDITIGNRIIRQLDEMVPIYLAMGLSSLDCLDAIFSSKILRKLESRYDSSLRNGLTRLIKMLESEFGLESFALSKALINKYLRRSI